MLLEIDHHSGVPIYRQIINQLRKQIMAGQLSAGEQLMTVRDLAERLRVNPMTVSKAYSLLEIEGLVDRRRGVGLFVAELDRPQKNKKSLEMLEDSLGKAVISAIQFGVAREDVSRMVNELYEKYNSKTGSK